MHCSVSHTQALGFCSTAYNATSGALFGACAECATDVNGEAGCRQFDGEPYACAFRQNTGEYFDKTGISLMRPECAKWIVK